jgi:pyrroline-5-carboxylate reductase
VHFGFIFKRLAAALESISQESMSQEAILQESMSQTGRAMTTARDVIGLIGAGHFGAALVQGFLRAGRSADSILISARGRESEALARAHGIERVTENAALVRRARAVILAVRPTEAADAVRGLPWRPNQLLLSVCAGVTCKALADAAGGHVRAVRALPMTAASHGASPTPCFPEDEEARALLSPLGTVITLAAESQMATATAAAIVYTLAHDLIARTADWAGAQGMDSMQARALAAAFFGAAAESMARDDGTPLDALIARLATKGGIAEAAYGLLRTGRYDETWRQALGAALARVKALAD